ncbi:MAG: hypothetical protein MI861_21635, partial [Pirellulales bacterium]|nr:hypothetical protein [Pirellulales bacterium]
LTGSLAGALFAAVLGLMFSAEGPAVLGQSLEFTVYVICGGLAGLIFGSIAFAIYNYYVASTKVCRLCGGKTKSSRCENSLCSGYKKSAGIAIDQHARHWVVNVWVGLIIIVNLGSFACASLCFMMTLGPYVIKLHGADDDIPIPIWFFGSAIQINLFNIVCMLALLRWRRWGFYGFTVSVGVAIVLNLAIGMNPWLASIAALGPLILLAILNVGGSNRVWPKLT